MPELLTHADVCEWLKVDRSTLRRWRAAGKFPQPDVRTGVLRWKRETVLAWCGLVAPEKQEARAS